jgi:hypothetical protein
MNSQCWKPQESLKNFLNYVKCRSFISYLLHFFSVFLSLSDPFQVLFSFIGKLENVKKKCRNFHTMSTCEVNLGYCLNLGTFAYIPTTPTQPLARFSHAESWSVMWPWQESSHLSTLKWVW